MANQGEQSSVQDSQSMSHVHGIQTEEDKEEPESPELSERYLCQINDVQSIVSMDEEERI